MDYVNKSPQMSAFLNSVFPHEDGQCAFCKVPVGEFRDALSRREYEISHLCQACQDSAFGGPVSTAMSLLEGEEEDYRDEDDGYTDEDHYGDEQVILF